MKIRPGEILIVLGRLLVGGVLLYAGFMKAVGPTAEFAAILEAYKLFPAAFLSPLSIAVPYVEMWIGLFLVTGLFTRQAAGAASLLFSAFFLVILSTLLRGIDLTSCGCFGADALSPRHTLVLDAGFLVLSLFLYRSSKVSSPLSLDRSFP